MNADGPTLCVTCTASGEIKSIHRSFRPQSALDLQWQGLPERYGRLSLSPDDLSDIGGLKPSSSRRLPREVAAACAGVVAHGRGPESTPPCLGANHARTSPLRPPVLNQRIGREIRTMLCRCNRTTEYLPCAQRVGDGRVIEIHAVLLNFLPHPCFRSQVY